MTVRARVAASPRLEIEPAKVSVANFFRQSAKAFFDNLDYGIYRFVNAFDALIGQSAASIEFNALSFKVGPTNAKVAHSFERLARIASAQAAQRARNILRRRAFILRRRRQIVAGFQQAIRKLPVFGERFRRDGQLAQIETEEVEALST